MDKSLKTPKSHNAGGARGLRAAQMAPRIITPPSGVEGKCEEGVVKIGDEDKTQQ